MHVEQTEREGVAAGQGETMRRSCRASSVAKSPPRDFVMRPIVRERQCAA